MKRRRLFVLCISLVLVLSSLAGCSDPLAPRSATAPESTSTPIATNTPVPTNTPLPTPTPLPLPAEEILDKSLAAMQAVESFQFTMEATIEAMGVSVIVPGQGAFRQPDQMYVKVTFLGQDNEMLASSSGIHLRQSRSDKWASLTPQQGAQGIVPNIHSQVQISEFASSSTLLGEEALNGVNTYVIAYEMDIGRYLLKDPFTAALIDPENTQGSGKIWIAQDTYLVQKTTMDFDTVFRGNEAAVQLEFTLFGFDQPVEMPTP